VETARKESAAKNDAGVETVGNGNNDTKLQGVENVRHKYSGKAEYGKPLIAKYMQTGTAAVGKC